MGQLAFPRTIFPLASPRTENLSPTVATSAHASRHHATTSPSAASFTAGRSHRGVRSAADTADEASKRAASAEVAEAAATDGQGEAAAVAEA